MREIKLRAWDICQEKMFVVDKLSINENKVSYTQTDIDMYGVERTVEVTLPLYAVILLESTGFFDSDNKPIYEGDVLYDEVNDSYSGRVAWDHAYGHYYVHFGERIEILSVYNTKLFSVAGNVYENPEFVDYFYDDLCGAVDEDEDEYIQTQTEELN